MGTKEELREFSERVIAPAMERFASMSPEEQDKLLAECGMRLDWVVTPKPPAKFA